jgi:ACS family glucarate transporter-like MFS transporter
MVFGLIGPITFVMSLDRTAIVIAAPTMQHEYGFSLVQMSLILTSFSWTYAAFQVPAGWLAEKFAPRRALAWANLMWSLLTMATPLGFSVASFVGIRALLGLEQSADWPASVLALHRWFPRRERSKGNSVLLGALYLGPIAAGPASALVIANFGWRAAFYSSGCWACCLARRGGPGSATSRKAIPASPLPNSPPSRRTRTTTRRSIGMAPSCAACGRCSSGRSGCSISS